MNKLQASNTKLKGNSKHQGSHASALAACGLWIPWCLEFLAFFFMKPTALVSEQSEVRTKPCER